MTKRKVVLIPFPFDDLSKSKVRPAVCLTDPIGPYRHVVTAFVTSGVPTNLFTTDIIVRSRDVDFASTGLRITSTIQLHRLVTVATRVIRRNLGALSPRLQADVDDGLRNLLAL